MTSSSANFYWKHIVIHQQDDVFKVGTDALLLGSWIPKLMLVKHSVLDVGTGTGILALLMAGTFPDARVMAIDIHPEAILLARQNIAQSNWADRIKVMHSALTNFANECETKFDLIVCNPPFFQHSILPGLLHLQKAKHNVQNPQEWMIAMSKLLGDHGHVCIILPEPIVFEWVRAANLTGLYCQHRLDVFSFVDDKLPKRTMMKLGRELTPFTLEELVMHDNPQTYTSAYEDWLKS